MTLTEIGLFAGIGGFQLGFQRAGIRTVALVEKDRDCQNVLRRRFPDVPVLDDVCTAGAHNLPWANLISFGFPCQDLSVAGNRAGLAGARSGLFYEATRIVHELQPDFAIWENVPGLLSSGGGKDFAAVLMELERIGYCGCWTTLDAQFFGLAQRRQRVFGVFARRDIGAARCAEILALTTRLPWNTPARPEARANVAASLTAGTSSGRGVNAPGRRREDDVNIVGTLSPGAHPGSYNGQDAYSGLLIPAPAIAQSNRGNAGDTFETLRSASHGALPMVASAIGASHTYDRGDGADNLVAGTLRASHGSPRGDAADNLIASALTHHHGRNSGEDTNVSSPAATGVRRLTPTECERLQGFPDGWTEGQPDSTRYRQLGNAVATPVAAWIGRQLVVSALLARLEALGLTLTYDPREHAEWRLDGCGSPSWSSLVALEEWLAHQERAERRKEAA